MKTKMCEVKDYRLIHIWEDKWNDKTKEKLKQVFKGEEVIDYSKPLDRSWYSVLQLKNKKFEFLPPQLVIRNGFSVENCGSIYVGDIYDR